MNFFSPDTLDLHNEYEQIEQQLSLSKFKVRSSNTTGQSYETSLQQCSCDYFNSTHRPCGHMYALAKKLGLFNVIKNKRSDKLIADFTDGYATGWKFIVRACNYLELDILLTPRSKNNVVSHVLTQGPAFDFHKGTVFYDSILAYTLPWGEALKKINYSIQIDKAIGTDINYVVDMIDGVLTTHFVLEYGEVTFSIYAPKSDFSRLEKLRQCTCRQNEFVEILKNGFAANV